ncbi:hypothetical protein IEQ44_04570 [Nocardioides sp. Y6]|uniref:Uncharacterized protein n=1 Tax=Nocardioides malaquae TaxID=2773426 RepID=A0ABR9RQS9_9ACTN|nr:hypothetical protein [Nocardioides malaquae]MBE7323923.1 hypothetical protein [Nocardioides malaquae]
MAGRIRTSLAYWLSPLFLAIPFLGLQGPPYTSDPYASPSPQAPPSR